MKDYSYNDIREASEEAFRMQSNSKFREDDFEKYKCNCRFEKREAPQNGKSCQNSGSLFSSTGIEDDKLLILALILILSKNCNDKLLMAALLYIIM